MAAPTNAAVISVAVTALVDTTVPKCCSPSMLRSTIRYPIIAGHLTVTGNQPITTSRAANSVINSATMRQGMLRP
uniref:Putative secreted protein n=1 Tax=Anopheles darlingi TaxID=43151 RepID=A0A2M4D2E2_ANODA